MQTKYSKINAFKAKSRVRICMLLTLDLLSLISKKLNNLVNWIKTKTL